MKLGETTLSLLRQLETLSGGRLSYPEALGMLIEIAQKHKRQQQLDDLSFYAKFAHKSFGIMSRIGKDGDGYDKLSKEFGESLEKVRAIVGELLVEAPDEERKKFASDFLENSQQSFAHLLTLLYDLSWYKNYRLDTARG